MARDSQKTSILTKISKICSRLILLNQAMIIGVGESDEMPDVICTEAVESAIAQAAYFKTTAFYVFSILQEQESDGRQMMRDAKCDWLKIFTTQDEVTNGMPASDIVNKIVQEFGKSTRTAKAWIKNDLQIAQNLPEDDKRTKRYTI